MSVFHVLCPSQWPFNRPNMGHLFFNKWREGSSSLVLVLSCKFVRPFRIVWKSEYKKNFGSSYTQCFTDRTAIVIITTLALSPFPTALPEHKQSCRNFQTGTQFAHYRIVLFRSVHSLKTTGSNDGETLWLQGSVRWQAFYFSSKGMLSNCAGLRDDVIWAGVTWFRCFFIVDNEVRSGVILHSLTAKSISVQRFCSKLETPFCG